VTSNEYSDLLDSSVAMLKSIPGVLDAVRYEREQICLTVSDGFTPANSRKLKKDPRAYLLDGIAMQDSVD
jgi:hypothetical protein